MAPRSVTERAATLQRDHVVSNNYSTTIKSFYTLFAADHMHQSDLVGAASCCLALSAHLGEGVRMLKVKEQEAWRRNDHWWGVRLYLGRSLAAWDLLLFLFVVNLVVPTSSGIRFCSYQ